MLTSIDHTTFSDQIRDALAHFYDLSVLQTHPLIEILTVSSVSQSTRGQTLRSLLADTVEMLRPKDAIPFDRPEWLIYRAIALRYMECLTPAQACRELGLGRTSFYKYLNIGLQGVADILWQRVERRDASDLEPERQGEAQASAEQEAKRVAQAAVRQPVHLWALVEGVLITLSPLLREQQIVLTAEPPPRCPLVYGDPAMLRQAVLGILTEVVIRTAPGHCRLDLDVQGSQVVCRIRGDDRWDPGWTHLMAATGVALAKSVLAVYGGYLLVLPDDQGRPSIVFALPTLPPRTILVIDDDPTALQLYRHYLQAEGYDVRVTTDAQSAWRTLQDVRPDAIILDVLMPQEDGWNVLQRVRTYPETQSIPVLICSVLSQPQLALALGANQVLQKPVDQEQLLRALQRLTLPSTEDGVHLADRADSARL